MREEEDTELSNAERVWEQHVSLHVLMKRVIDCFLSISLQFPVTGKRRERKCDREQQAVYTSPCA